MIRYSWLVLLALSTGGLAQDGLPKGAKLQLGDPTFRTHLFFGAAISSDGKMVAYRNGKDNLQVVESLTGKTIRNVPIPNTVEIGRTFSFTANNQKFLFIAPENVHVVDGTTGKLLLEIPKQGTLHSHFIASQDGKSAISYGRFGDTFVTIWDLETGKSVGKVSPSQNGMLSASISADGKIILTSGFHEKRDNTQPNYAEIFQVWDAKTQKEIRQVPCGAVIQSANISPDGKLAAVKAGFVNPITIYDLETGKVALEIPSRKGFNLGFSRALFFSGDNQRLAVVNQLGEAELWDLKAKKSLGIHDNRTESIAGVGFTAEGKAVVCGVLNQSIPVWTLPKDPGAREVPAKTLGHYGNVLTMRFTPDGKQLLSFGRDNRILRWDVATGKPIEMVADLGFDNNLVLDIESSSKAVFSDDCRYLVRVTLVPQRGFSVYDLTTKKDITGFATSRKDYPSWQRFYFARDSSKLYGIGHAQNDKSQTVACILVWELPGKRMQRDTRQPVKKFLDSIPTGERSLRANFPKDFPPAAKDGSGPPEVVLGETVVDSWTRANDVARRVQVKDPATKKMILDVEANLIYTSAVSLSPDGKLLAVGWNNSTIVLYELGK